MDNIKDFRRCGQCGRRFTKFTWKTNNYWCPNCNKFICFSCQVKQSTCPTCEGKLNHYIEDLYVFLLIGGITFFVMGLLMTIISRLQYPITICFMIVGIFGFFFVIQVKEIIDKQNKKHLKYISSLPPGIIPKKERKKKSKSVEEIINEKHKDRSHGLLDESQYLDLEGDWAAPVLSKEERKEVLEKFRRQFLPAGIILIVIGLIILVMEYYYSYYILYGLWIMPLALGGIFVFSVIALELKTQTEGPFYIMVPIKRVNLGDMKNLIENYLEKRKDRYKFKTMKKSLAKIYTLPQYRYTFDNGNFLFFTATNSTSAYGGSNCLVIGYTYDNVIHAKKLQSELDKLLSDKDFIYTIK